MWVDLLISAPVTLFLLWLYWYSAPDSAPGWSRLLDRIALLISPLAVIVIIAVGHAWIEYPGMGLNVMLVAAAYVTLIFVLGLGWMQRALAVRGNSGVDS
ncbi:MAG: hypothetical protein CMP07_05330 [Xanthomonadales bacterium]|nr:hypothetical protein [Xanthomonadales bacterium]|tara:strand:+ start:222 stop:521 length:300 start_codon:yes stop_codon:yes gene_type:complete